MTSAGPVQAPFPTGGLLTPDGRTFHFMVVDDTINRSTLVTDLSDIPPGEWFEDSSRATFTTRLPAGWDGDSARLVVTMPGNVLVDEQVSVAGGQVTWELKGGELNALASNFDTGGVPNSSTGGGLYDTLTITIYAEGIVDGMPSAAVASMATHGTRVPDAPPPGDL